MAEGLARSLGEEDDFEVVGVAHDRERALAQVTAHRPDVVILDLILGNVSGIQVAREVQELGLDARIILLSSYINPTFVHDAVALEISGYLTKEATKQQLSAAIRAVAAGETAFCPAARKIAANFSDASSNRIDVAPDLTPREREVFRLRSVGHSYSRVASRLGIEASSVRTLWDRALYKLGVKSAPRIGYVLDVNGAEPTESVPLN
jgi:DNA-binding NarL/FixJ family response regulator